MIDVPIAKELLGDGASEEGASGKQQPGAGSASALDSEEPAADSALAAVPTKTRKVVIVGVLGAVGVGKSTLAEYPVKTFDSPLTEIPIEMAWRKACPFRSYSS